MIRYGSDFCEAITAVPKTPDDALNIAFKATEAAKVVNQASLVTIHPNGIRAILNSGWPPEIQRDLARVYAVFYSLVGALGWMQLVNGYPLRVEPPPDVPLLRSDLHNQADELSMILEGLGVKAWKIAR